MKIRILPERNELDLPGRQRVADALRQLDMLPGTVMVIRNDELLTDDAWVEENDTIEIRRVMSGG